MKPLRRRANCSVWASARLFGTSSPKTIVNRLRSRVTMIRASAPAEVDRIGRPLPSNACSRLAVRLTAA